MAGRGRRTTIDNVPETYQPELDGMPDRIWPNYDGQPVDRVDMAFGGFNVKDPSMASALQQYGKEIVLTIKGRVITHNYKSKFDKDFGDSRSQVAVTFMPTEIVLGGQVVVINQEPEDGDGEDGDD